MLKSEIVGQAKLALAVVHHKQHNNLLHSYKYLCNIFTSLFKIYIFPFSLTLYLTSTFMSKEPITSTTCPAKTTEEPQPKRYF